MTDTITLRYGNETYRIRQTYWGTDPEWQTEDGTTITTTQAEASVREQQYTTALDTVSTSDYNPDTEAPVPYLTYNPDTDSIGANIEIQPLPDESQ
jgi:hypothetical protein